MTASEQLTEAWHKGKLESGWYWVKGERAVGIYAYTSEYLNNIYRPADGEKIVEKVPSFEEYTNLMSRSIALDELDEMFANEQEKNADLLEENTKLKELLDDCRIELDCWDDKDCRELIVKINQVLGED